MVYNPAGLPNPPISPILKIYLEKYVETATRGRVKFTGVLLAPNRPDGGLLKFKCNLCQDNWNVGRELFNNEGIPTELCDWVNQHRHICTQFDPVTKTTKPEMTTCVKCGWAGLLHEEIKDQLVNKALSQDTPNEGFKYHDYVGEFQKLTGMQPIPMKPGKTYAEWGDQVTPFLKIPPKEKLPEVKTLEEPQGRKFRD